MKLMAHRGCGTFNLTDRPKGFIIIKRNIVFCWVRYIWWACSQLQIFFRNFRFRLAAIFIVETMLLLAFCCCLIIWRLPWRETALFAVTVEGQVYVNFIDSSDTFIEGDLRCRLLGVCWLVLIAVCLFFGLCVGGVMTGCSAIVVVFCKS